MKFPFTNAAIKGINSTFSLGLPWSVGVETEGVLALLCNLHHRHQWIIGDGSNNHVCLHIAHQQAMQHLGERYNFPFALYRAKLRE